MLSDDDDIQSDIEQQRRMADLANRMADLTERRIHLNWRLTTGPNKPAVCPCLHCTQEREEEELGRRIFNAYRFAELSLSDPNQMDILRAHGMGIML